VGPAVRRGLGAQRGVLIVCVKPGAESIPEELDNSLGSDAEDEAERKDKLEEVGK